MHVGKREVKRYGHRIIAYAVSRLLRTGAVYDPVNFDLWQERGYHITPVHFYSPIPDTRELQTHITNCSTVPGIDLRVANQLMFLKEIFPRFAAEYNAFPWQSAERRQFALDNDAFGGIDSHVYYSMIRHFHPKKIIEVGSGFSTLVGAKASIMNGDTSYTSIDPWPREFIARGVPGVELLRKRVEEVDYAFFEQLKENDILFVDSSHVVRTGGDVSFLILEILPRLAKGVAIHFHDIYLPFEYPSEMIKDRHLFWTEQYLLHAYLVENCHARVLFASNYVAHEHPEIVKGAFPEAMWWGGGSFWIQKC